ncbi:TPA: hypothetical protein U2I44_003754 [Providencia rettgeri]|nr:hypothetical protein [Providencia rettgeri]
MNKFERIIYELLKKNAPLKNLFVLCYQSIFSFKSILSKKIQCNLDYQVFDGFFGFHDRPSLNSNGQLLIHRPINKFKNSMGISELGFIDIKNDPNTFKTIVTTSTCNYQQGSLATWLTENKIILNNSVNNSNRCQIYNTNGVLENELPFHFFSVSKCARYVTSISFARFGKGLNGYGYDVCYSDIEANDAKNKIPETELGDIFIYDLLTNKIVYRYSVQELNTISAGLLQDGYFYFSHSNFSPDSKFLYFLLRSSNRKLNTSQLLIVDLRSGKVLCAPTRGMVSHLDWISSTEIIAYCNCTIDRNDGYYIFTIKDGNIIAKKVNISRLTSDGHPSVLSNDIFITDTYPNRDRKQFLISVNLKKNKTNDIAIIFSPLKFRGINRTDLHPRISRCKNYLTIDTSYQNKRSQMVIDIKHLR